MAGMVGSASTIWGLTATDTETNNRPTATTSPVIPRVRGMMVQRGQRLMLRRLNFWLMVTPYLLLHRHRNGRRDDQVAYKQTGDHDAYPRQDAGEVAMALAGKGVGVDH